jgi:hypothetical protein
MVTNNVHIQAHALTAVLSFPRCQGPGSNLPNASLQLEAR